ncbi:MAG TPA: hypothetical protein GX008_02960 [Firmicutes bacterium]|jgi:cell division protein FtsB|nr:MAG: hypothetical protein AA931_02315 [Peptococcaceae bacterium 1109]HHT72655.1 hypothetical protein [Bacillota bacterium]
MVPARQIPSSYQWETTNPYEPPEPRRNLRPKRKRRRVPATVKLCLIAALVVSLGLLYISQQLNTVYLSLELANLQEEANLVKQRNGYLRVQLEQARSIQVIEELARTKLGMVDPSHTAVLVASNSLVGLRSEETGAGTLAGSNPPVESNAWTVVANWLNKLFPVGGVEAGKL